MDTQLSPAPASPRKLAVCSSTVGYNLGLAKLTSWARRQGWQVEALPRLTPFDGLLFDVIAISVIFSWDLPQAIEWGSYARTELWMGGPAVSANAAYVQRQLPHARLTIGPDARFERESGAFLWTRWGRGCPVNCWFCLVPKIDGQQAIEYLESRPARVIVDDNILRYSHAHQEHIVEQTLRAGLTKIDINSGFDPALFDPSSFDLYGHLDLLYWRTAYDSPDEAGHVERMIRLLRENGIPSRQIPVYLLAGAEPFESCMERAWQITRWGGEPRVQMYKPLTWMESRHVPWVHPRHGWTREQVINFPRYWFGYRWRTESWSTWLDRQSLPGRMPRQAEPSAEGSESGSIFR